MKIKEIEKIFEELVVMDSFDKIQSIDELSKKMLNYCAQMAFVNQEMASAKRALNEKKIFAYNTLGEVQKRQGFTLPASKQKDYVEALYSDHTFYFDLCERCSRTLVHTVDALRTCISALKMEKIYSSNQT